MAEQIAFRLVAPIIRRVIGCLRPQVTEPERLDRFGHVWQRQRRGVARVFKIIPQHCLSEPLAMHVDQQRAGHCLVSCLARMNTLDQVGQLATDDDPQRLLGFFLGDNLAWTFERFARYRQAAVLTRRLGAG